MHSHLEHKTGCSTKGLDKLHCPVHSTHGITPLFKKIVCLSFIIQSFTRRHLYFESLTENITSSFNFFTPKTHFRMVEVTAVISLIS